MKILVTGGCGMIGFNAVKHFHNRGCEVEVMDNLERASLLGHTTSNLLRRTFNHKILTDMGIKIYLDDVSKEESFAYLNHYDAIIHMAGQCGVPTSIANPRRDFEVNLMGTFNVLELARRTGAKVVFASTNKVYPIKDSEFVFDPSTDRWRFKDSTWDYYGFPATAQLPPASRTPYGWSKYSADLLCQEYFHTYGVKSGVFRMSCIYGPNQFGFEEQGWVTWFIIAMQKNLPINIFGDGKQVRDMLYVSDAVRAYETYLDSSIEHGVFNLGGGPENTLSINQSIDILTDMYGDEPAVSYHDWRPCDQKAYTSDTRPIKVWGWAPKVSIHEGLTAVRRWVAENEDVF